MFPKTAIFFTVRFSRRPTGIEADRTAVSRRRTRAGDAGRLHTDLSGIADVSTRLCRMDAGSGLMAERNFGIVLCSRPVDGLDSSAPGWYRLIPRRRRDRRAEWVDNG